ncbi:MAG: hypothetical protein H6732_11415 [Alphaproteobacteria bacterium]|nr:hypothetical protein [Alphaproteobacteria bacterium]
MVPRAVLLVLWGGCVAAPDDRPPHDTDPPGDSGVDTARDSDSAPPVDSDSSPPVDTSVDTDTAAPTPEERIAALDPAVWLRLDELGLANRASVSTWTSLAGTASQPESGRAPTYRDNTLPVPEVVRFDGVDDHLVLGSGPFVAADGAMTVFAVLSTEDREGHLVGIGHREPGGLARDGHALVVTEGRLDLVLGDGDLELVSLRGQGPAVSDGLPHVVSAVVRPRATVVFLDGEVGGMTAAMPPTRQLATLTRATVGAADGEALDLALSPLAMDLAELLVFPRALDTCARWEVEAYLAARHGLGVARQVTPPHVRHRVGSLDPVDGALVDAWPHETATVSVVGAAWNTDEVERPSLRLPEAAPPRVRFDGVDDRLDLSLDVFEAGLPTPVSVLAVLGLRGARGHVLGSGAGVPDRLRTFGAAVVADEGRLHLKAFGLSTGTSVSHPTDLVDEALHLVEADVTRTGLGLAVDGLRVDRAGVTEVPFLAKASLGASNGAGTGASIDPVAVDVSELRVYRYLLDACARELATAELRSTYDLPSPVGP